MHNAIPLSLAALMAPMLTLVPGCVLKEFGTSYLDWSC